MFLILLLTSYSQALDKILAWDLPEETNLAFYTLYEQIPNTPNFVPFTNIQIPIGQTVTTYTFKNYQSSTDRTFALSVTNREGKESELSNTVTIKAVNKGRKPR